jgi:hypothetical protein
MRGLTGRHAVYLVLGGLLVSTLACAVAGPASGQDNAVRRAALAHELAQRGPVDEVLVAFGLLDVRDNLGFKGGNTVWLNPVAQGEYFRQRDAGRTYLFLYNLSYENDRAYIDSDRGGPSGVQTHRLTLRAGNTGDWQVIGDDQTSQPR